MICCLRWVLNQKLCYASPKLFLQVLPFVTQSLRFRAFVFQSSHELCLTSHGSFEKFLQTSFSHFAFSFHGLTECQIDLSKVDFRCVNADNLLSEFNIHHSSS